MARQDLVESSTQRIMIMGVKHLPLPSLAYSYLLHFYLEDVNLSCECNRIYAFMLTAVVPVSKMSRQVEWLHSHPLKGGQ